jgi:hypothetical protein
MDENAKGGRLCATSLQLRPVYDRFYPMRLKNGDKNLISPAEFAVWENAEWPDPRW